MLRKALILACIVALLLPVTALAATPPSSLPAPESLQAEVKTRTTGEPYFYLTWTHPATVITIGEEESGDAPLGWELDVKMDTGLWDSEKGESLYYNNLHNNEGLDDHIEFAPLDVGLGDNIDIQAHTYSFRLRYTYSWSDETDDHIMRGSWSNIVTLGVPAYQNASSWAVEELNKGAQYGFITDRIKDNMAGNITREEFCEIVMRLHQKLTGEVTQAGENPFTDTTNPEILKAYQLGIVKGVGQGKFAPTQLVSRQEIAVMLFRAIKVCRPDLDTTVGNPFKFGDEAQIATWAINEVRFMYKEGIIKGSGGNFSPLGQATREQAVLMVVRTYETYVVESGS